MGIVGLVILIIGSLYFDIMDMMLCPIECRLPSLLVATVVMACGATIASRFFVGYWHIHKVQLARFTSLVSPILSWSVPIGTLLLALGYSPWSYPPSSIPELIVFGNLVSFVSWFLWGVMLTLWGMTFISFRKSPGAPPFASFVGILFIGGALIQLAILILFWFFGPLSAIHFLAYIFCSAIIWNTIEHL